MKIAIACDHAGYILKNFLIKEKYDLIDFLDLGTNSEDAVDYPIFAKKAALAISSNLCERAIVICGSGVGASIACNKFKGIRAAICHDTYSAHQGVEHDDMNILVLGARVIGVNLALEIVKSFARASFSKEERYLRRLNLIKDFENNWR